MPGGSSGGHGDDNDSGRKKSKTRVVSPNNRTSYKSVLGSRTPIIPSNVKPAYLTPDFIGSFPAGAMLPSGFFATQGYHPGHYGVDIAGPMGSPIYAPVKMTIKNAGWGNLGNEVRGVTPEGLEYDFGHFQNVAALKPGQIIPAGTLIGYEGSTFNADVGGYSSGPHLHLQIKGPGGTHVAPSSNDILYSLIPWGGAALGGSNIMTTVQTETRIKTGEGSRTVTAQESAPAVSGGGGSRPGIAERVINYQAPASSAAAPAQSSGSIQGAVNAAVSGAVAQTVDSLKPKWLKGKTALDIGFVFGGGALLIFGLIYILMALKNNGG